MGTVVSTVSKTLEQQQDCEDNKTRYERLCRMQRALDLHQEKALRRMMAEYEELHEITPGWISGKVAGGRERGR